MTVVMAYKEMIISLVGGLMESKSFDNNRDILEKFMVDLLG